jgi:hypothetical protein
MNEKHSNQRTEAIIQHAEEWCDRQPVFNGMAPESVGIVRQLIGRLMEHDKGLTVTLDLEGWALVIGTLIVMTRDTGEAVFEITAEQISGQVRIKRQHDE